MPSYGLHKHLYTCGMNTHAHIGRRGTYIQRETDEMEETPSEINAFESIHLMHSGNANNL